MLFAGRELSLGEAAKLANLDLKRLHYHAQRLVRFGLLEVAATRRHLELQHCNRDL